MTTLIGREEAVADACRLLTGREIKKGPPVASQNREASNVSPVATQNPQSTIQNQRVRLLTLTGMGGCGKTRLALQVAAEVLEEYADGVWFVELAPVTDAALIPQTIAHALRADVEQAGHSVRDTLIDTLKQKSTLLVLDNCEHLIDAAARIAEDVLRACPNVQILATSRESLDIRGETTWRVAPLPVPTSSTDFSVDSLLRYEALRLFVERAQAANRNWSLTPQNAAYVCGICRRLDGIPLALELAARRVKGMTVEAIADQLADRFIRWTGNRTDPLRQQTLEAAIDWSYALLLPEERTLLTRLSIFVGGFTHRRRADRLCGCGGEGGSTGGSSCSFRSSRSLAAPGGQIACDVRGDAGGRWTLSAAGNHSAVWPAAAGAGKRGGAGRRCGTNASASRRVVLEILAEQAEPRLQGAQQALWLDRLERKHDNLRAALQGCLHEETRLKLASALWRFWYIRGYYSEGRSWLEGALTRGRSITPAVRANALNAVGILAMTQGDCETAQRFYEESYLFSTAPFRPQR